MASRAGANRSFAFSLDIKEEAEREVAPVDFPLPREVGKREVFYPIFALVSVGLFQLGLYQGYLGADVPTVVIVGHILSLVLGLVVVAVAHWNPAVEAFKAIKSFDFRSGHLTALTLLGLAIAAALDLTQSDKWYSGAETFTVTSSLLALWFAVARRLTQKFILDCTFLPDTFPEFVTRLKIEGDTLEETAVKTSEVALGDIIRCRVGSVVAFDGTVVDGIVELRERRLTGEAIVCIKGLGDPVYAGSEIVTGAIDIKVQALAADAYISSFAGTVRGALSQLIEKRSELNRLKNRIYLGVLFISTIAAVFWIGTGARASYALTVFSTILLLGSMVPAINLVPLLARRFLLLAFSRGVLFRDFSKSFATLAKVDVGVLHEGDDVVPVDVEIRTFELVDERVDKDALLSVLFSLFGRSRNTVHLDIAEKIRGQIDKPSLYDVSQMEISDDQCSPCPSIDAVIEHIPFVIGSEEVLLSRGVQLQTSEMAQGAVYVAMQGEIVALLMFAAPEKNRFRNLRDRLEELKVRSVICSEAKTSFIAPVAGISAEDTFLKLDKHQTVEKIRSLSPSFLLTGKSSDISVIESADVSFSFFDDLKWSVSNTDVTLFTARLSTIVDCIRDARAFYSVVKNFLIFASSLCVLLVGLAVVGLGRPEVSVLSIALSGLYAFILFDNSKK